MAITGIDSTGNSIPQKNNNPAEQQEISGKISVFLEDGVIDVDEQGKLLEDAIAKDSQLQEAKAKGVDMEFYIARFLHKAKDFTANTKEAIKSLVQRLNNYINNVKIYVNNETAGKDTVLVAPESVIISYNELKQAELAEKNNSNAQTIEARDLAYDKFFQALTEAGYLESDILQVGKELVNLNNYFFE